MVGFGANAASAGDEGKLSSVGTEILLENSQLGSASALGTVGWYSSFVTVPAMFTEFQVSSRRAFGRRVALTSQDMKSSREVDELSFQASWTEQEKKAKGLVH